MDKKAKTFFPAISRISNFKTRLLFGFATIFLILSIIYFAYRHLSNTTMQYVVLVIVLFFMSMIIFMKAFERVEWKRRERSGTQSRGAVEKDVTKNISCFTRIYVYAGSIKAEGEKDV